MDARNAPFQAVLRRLQQEQGAQVSARFVSDDGNTALSVLAAPPERVTVGVMSAEIVLSQGLGRLTLDAHDLSSIEQLPGVDTWRLVFGPLSITIEFGGTP